MAIQVEDEPSGFERLPTVFPLLAYQRVYVLLNRGKVQEAYALLLEFDLELGEQEQGFV